MQISLQPTFYPQEAEKKGATPSQYGFVFGIASLASLISTPIMGMYAAKIGVKRVFNSGAFIQGLCGISFGFLIYLDSLSAFLGLSYFLRFLDGVADAAAYCCGMSVLIKLFPDKVSSIVAWFETLFGFGYMMGPFVGSVLYHFGGFVLPFFVVGIWCLIGGFGIFFTFPDIEENTNCLKKRMSISDLVKYPSIILPGLDLFFCACGNGFIESMLASQMVKLDSTQAQIGMTFFLFGLIYLISTPVAGFVSFFKDYFSLFIPNSVLSDL